LSDLRPLLAIQGDPIFRIVTRWPQAIPQYELGHNERLARIDAILAEKPGLHVCANWRGGISLADCVSSAAALADTLTAT